MANNQPIQMAWVQVRSHVKAKVGRSPSLRRSPASFNLFTSEFSTVFLQEHFDIYRRNTSSPFGEEDKEEHSRTVLTLFKCSCRNTSDHTSIMPNILGIKAETDLCALGGNVNYGTKIPTGTLLPLAQIDKCSCRNTGPVLHMIRYLPQQKVIAFEIRSGLCCWELCFSLQSNGTRYRGCQPEGRRG